MESHALPLNATYFSFLAGVQRQTAHCVKKGRGVVKNFFCDLETQPNGKQKKCVEKDCLPR